MIEDQRGRRSEPTTPGPQLGKFVNLLFFEIYKHYGKSVRDEHLTIAQLREKGRRLDKKTKESEKSQCGLSSGTVNRHLTFLGQIFDHASARGLEDLNKIDLSEASHQEQQQKRGQGRKAQATH